MRLKAVKTILYFVAYLLVISCSKSTDKITDPLVVNDSSITQHQLQNGMSVLFKALPEEDGFVHIHWNVLAGQYNQKIQDNDVAHILEHSLFDVAGFENFEKQMSLLGGYSNATTAAHYTSYQFKVKPEKIDEVLDIIAKWQNLTELNENKHQVNLDIVKQEWQFRNNSVGGLYGKPYFKKNSNYIGYNANYKKINKVDTAQLFDFYKTWYHPENTHLLVMGKVDQTQILTSIKEKNSIKWNQPVKFTTKQKIELNKSRAFVKKKNMKTDGVLYQIFNQSDAESKEKDTLISLLISYIIEIKLDELKYKNTELIDFDIDFLNLNMGASVLSIDVSIQSGKLSSIMTQIDAVFDQINTEKVSEQVMALAKQRFIKMQVDPLDSVDIRQFKQFYYKQLELLDAVSSSQSYQQTLMSFINDVNDHVVAKFSRNLLNDHVFVFIKKDDPKQKVGTKNDLYFKANIDEFIKKKKKIKLNSNKENQLKINAKLAVPVTKEQVMYQVEFSDILNKNVYSWKLDNGLTVQFVTDSQQRISSNNKFSMTYYLRNPLDTSSARLNGVALLWSHIQNQSNFLSLPAYQLKSKYHYRVVDRNQIKIHGDSEYFETNMNLLYEILMTPINDDEIESRIKELTQINFANPNSAESLAFHSVRNQALFNEKYARALFDVQTLTDISKQDLNYFHDSRLNTNLQPTLLIVGDLTVEQVHKEVNKYISALGTNDQTMVDQSDFIKKINTPYEDTAIVVNKKIKGSSVNYYIADKLDVDFENRQARWILAYAIYNRLYDEVRSKNGLAYAFGVNTAYINDGGLLNELRFNFSSSITDSERLNAFIRPVITSYMKEPITQEDFERAKNDVRVNYYNELDVEQFTIDELLYYLKTADRYAISFDKAVNAKFVTQSVTLDNLHQLQADINDHASHIIVFETQ